MSARRMSGAGVRRVGKTRGAARWAAPALAGVFAAAPAIAAAALACVALLMAGPAAADPCIDSVVSFTAGANGGFQADLLPDVVLGPPRGAGAGSGSLDVVSLGNNGTTTVAFDDNEIVDGPGVDFVVFENAFIVAGGGGGTVFTEVGIVSASEDGASFVPFAYNPTTLAGLAGVTPVYSHPDNGIDPRDPAAGGDRFDLATIGLASARYLRIVDPGATIADYGNQIPVQGVGKSGFDLDAVVAVHSRDLCAGCCDVDGDGTTTPADVLLLVRLAAGSPVAVDPCGAPSCGSLRCADADDDGGLATDDALACLDLASELAAETNCPAASGACDLPP